MVVFQNGLCEERIAPIAGPGRVIGAIVAWGASMVEPGVYDRTSAGGFTLGNKDGSHDERLRNLALLLEAIGPVTLTDNLMGARWSKLAINCAISSIGTVGGDRLGALLRKRYVRRLALEVMTETVEVARMDAIRLEKVSGTLDLEWIALTEAERTQAVGSPSLFAKHTLLLAVGTRYRRLRSSMLNAIERGRPVAVDFLNGEVVERGKRYGIATPINAALLEEVKRIAAGNSRAAHDTLAALYRRTREALAPPTVDAAVSASAPASTAASIAGVESAAPPSSGIPPTLQQDTVELPADAHPQIRDETIELPRE
jgi:2-dehydropantoate 2-reductase